MILYPNRLEIIEKAGPLLQKENTYLLKTITHIELQGLTKTVFITTTDGKKQEIKIFGKDAEQLKAALLPLLKIKSGAAPPFNNPPLSRRLDIRQVGNCADHPVIEEVSCTSVNLACE